LHLRGDQHLSLDIPANIERHDSDRITSDQKRPAAWIVQHERDNAVHTIQKLARPLHVIHIKDDLAVGVRLNVMVRLELAPECLVVVDLAIDREYAARADIPERLRAVLDVDDREPLVCEYRALVAIDAAPVGPPMPQLAGHRERKL